MSRIKTFLIGRHQDCDLVLDDSSVSRYHAEVVLTPEGGYYIADRGSSGGTFIHSGSGWRPVRQELVNSTDRLRFGDHEISASRLISLRAPAGCGGAAAGLSGQGAAHEPPAREDDGLDPNKKIMRNPDTGELLNNHHNDII